VPERGAHARATLPSSVCHCQICPDPRCGRLRRTNRRVRAPSDPACRNGPPAEAGARMGPKDGGRERVREDSPCVPRSPLPAIWSPRPVARTKPSRGFLGLPSCLQTKTTPNSRLELSIPVGARGTDPYERFCSHLPLVLVTAADSPFSIQLGRRASFSLVNWEEKHCIRIPVAFCLYLVKII
jgi:hypothetical protein